MGAQVGPKTNFRKIWFSLRRLNASLDARKVGPRKTQDIFGIIIAHGACFTIESKIEIGIEKVIDFLGAHYSSRRKRNSAPHLLLNHSWAQVGPV